ncbi:MAG: hypothetical protein WA894_09600, partial [Candidatus Acidiferrum sp.]
MRTKTRRQFLKSTAISAAGLMAMRSLPAWSDSSVTVAVTPPLSVFGYSQVQLLEGHLRTQFVENHERFLNLDEDGLLKPFREREGLPAPGPDMGGWYDNSNDFS